MRKILIWSVMVLLIIATSIIVPPRVWVKNKTAEVIYDGRLSEDVKLFHGNHDRLLFYLGGDHGSAYVYSARAGLRRCPAHGFVDLKLIAVAARTDFAGCQLYGPSTREQQSLKFVSAGKPVSVSWQAAPR